MASKIPKIILIDEDEGVRCNWAYISECCGHKIIMFKNYDDLFKSLDNFDKDDIFFCDWRVNGEFIGIEDSKKLYERGFKKIYLQTGNERSAKEIDAPWLCEILGKGYPKSIINRHLKIEES